MCELAGVRPFPSHVPLSSRLHLDIPSGFMSKFHVKLSARAKKDVGNNVAMFDAMYADREKLETIFRFFDTDGNGSISREEFHRVRTENLSIAAECVLAWLVISLALLFLPPLLRMFTFSIVSMASFLLLCRHYMAVLIFTHDGDESLVW